MHLPHVLCRKHNGFKLPFSIFVLCAISSYCRFMAVLWYVNYQFFAPNGLGMGPADFFELFRARAFDTYCVPSRATTLHKTPYWCLFLDTFSCDAWLHAVGVIWQPSIIFKKCHFLVLPWDMPYFQKLLSPKTAPIRAFIQNMNACSMPKSGQRGSDTVKLAVNSL